MSVLVIGASGQVGRHLMAALQATGRQVHGTCWQHREPGLTPLDVRDPAAVRRCLDETRASVVYVAAALSHVDYCESHPDESYAINVAPIETLAATGARLVFLSTDYVFDGEGGPYREADPVRPLSVYGRHKALAEQAVPCDSLIIRTTVVYGSEPRRKNFIYRLLDTLLAGQELAVPADQVGSPTYAPDLARATVQLEQQGADGVLHVAGPRRASRYDFARKAADVFGLDARLLQPIATSDLRQPARRPLDAGLVVDKAQAQLDFPLAGFDEGLRSFAAELAVRS